MTTLTTRQAQYLRTISEADPGTPYTTIATTLAVSKQAVGANIQALRKQGVVDIKPWTKPGSRQHYRHVELTPLGRLLLAQVQS